MSAHAREAADMTVDETSLHKFPGVVSLDFEEFRHGQHSVVICLAGEIDTLRKTPSGKLILNK